MRGRHIDLDRSTMAGWVGCMAALLDPLVAAVGKYVCAGEVLHADDTTVKVLAPGLGRTKTGRLWAVVRDERGLRRSNAAGRVSAERPLRTIRFGDVGLPHRRSLIAARFDALDEVRRLASRFASYCSTVTPSMPVAPSLRVSA
jgi:hypothetical protein